MNIRNYLLIITAALLTLASPLRAQDKVYESQFNSDFDIDGTWSKFDGGNQALEKWLSSHIQYPKDAIADKQQGKVTVSFVVEKDGSISSPIVKEGISKSLDAEALRLASSMPKWKPAYSYGVPCRTRNLFTVKFTLPNKTGGNAVSSEIDWTCSQGQRLYEGSYPFHKIEGYAKYQYREASDGTRVYDGWFEFKGNQGFYAKGQFKNDLQIGKWIYRSGTTSATISFDNSGSFNGKYSVTSGSIKTNGYCSNGHLGTINYADGELTTAGNLNYQEQPTGVWRLRILNDPNHHYTYEYDYSNKPMEVVFGSPGNCSDWYFTDPSTGDKKRPQRGDWTLNGPEGIMQWCVDKTKGLLSTVLLRGSVVRNGYQR